MKQECSAQNSFTVCNRKPNHGAVRGESKIRHAVTLSKNGKAGTDIQGQQAGGPEDAYQRHEPEAGEAGRTPE